MFQLYNQELLSGITLTDQFSKSKSLGETYFNFTTSRRGEENKIVHQDPKSTSGKESPDTCESLYWFPQFLSEVGPLKSEYSCEWKRYLVCRNQEAIRKSANSRERFSFYMPNVVESVFNVCKILRQPPEVRYLAVDILDRFLVEHFKEVRLTFEQKVEEENSVAWDEIVDRMLKQSTLRILTAVQLAMKYSWSCNIITAADIQKMMEYLGHKEHYPKRSILKSEKRIYRQINFNVPKTPLTYMEMFFDEFQKNGFFCIKMPLHKFFNTCIQVLDVAIIFHQKIYNNWIAVKEKTSGGGSNGAVSLKANFIVLSASVIFASSILEDPSAVMSKILLDALCSVGECKRFDIEALGKEIIDTLFSI